MKVKVESEVVVPHDMLVYDIGREAFVCNECNKVQAYTFIDKNTTRDGGPCPSTAFKEFVAKHTKCIGKKEVQRIRDEATQPCRQDYRNAQGVYPLECGKVDGHSGPCGPG